MKKSTMGLYGLVSIQAALVLSHQRKAFAETQQEETVTNAEGKVITSGVCTDFKLTDIPTGNFFPPYQLPIGINADDLKLNAGVTRVYNTGPEEEYHGGHDGLDMAKGKQKAPVYSTQPMLIITSHKRDKHPTWGESIIGATRVSQYSEEILTFHFHHLDDSSEAVPYTPTRQYNACEVVGAPGVRLANMGKTGNVTGIHLHYSVRRWKNLTDLNDAINRKIPGGLYGFGYKQFAEMYAPPGYNHLEKHLDPLRILTDSFAEFEEKDDTDQNDWFKAYAQHLRHIGAEFGTWDGKFGGALQLTRGEATRWLHVAMKLQLPLSGTLADVPIFVDDVKKGSEFFPYVQQLTEHPQGESVVNGNVTCIEGQKGFCPTRTIIRAEALKMNIMAFFGGEYISFWENNYPSLIPQIKIGSVHQFSDVDVGNPQDPNQAGDWFASHVYFGLTELNDKLKAANNTTEDLVAHNPSFSPANPVNRAEFSKWLVLLSQTKFGKVKDPCTGVSCPAQQYCVDGACQSVPICIPSEANECGAVGGGGPSTCDLSPQCVPWQSQTKACNGGIQTRFCTDDCGWGAWTPCSSGVAECSPGDSQVQPCVGNGTQTRTCDANGNWGSWGTCVPVQSCVCSGGPCCDGCNYYDSNAICNTSQIYQCQGSSPGQDAEVAQVTQYCSGFDAICSGTTSQSSWQVFQDCASNQICQMSGGNAFCTAAPCTDAYLKSQGGECDNNPAGSGSPTLCLEAQQISGAQWQYRVCKSGGAFQSNFEYTLRDDNQSVIFTKYLGSSGSSCSSWQTANLSYIPGYNPANGAGLRMHVSSPSGCAQAACQYYTGTITVYKVCQ